MTATATMFAVLAALAAAVNWYAVAAGHRRLEYVAKPLTTAALVGVAVTLDPVDEAQRAWFTAAVVFSLAGDVFLMLPQRFVAGLASFGLAHLAYVAGFAQTSVDPARAVLGLGVMAAAVATVGRRVLSGLRRGPQAGLFAPAAAYVAVIAAMVVAAFAAGPWLAVAGASLFLLSDGLLAWDRFVTPVPAGPVVVMVTYHLGQGGLIASLALGS